MASYHESFLFGVYEEAAPALHIPFVVGNQLFLLTQVDKRKVVDIRELTCRPWMPSCQFPASQAPVNYFTMPVVPQTPPIQRTPNLADYCKFFFPDLANNEREDEEMN